MSTQKRSSDSKRWAGDILRKAKDPKEQAKRDAERETAAKKARQKPMTDDLLAWLDGEDK